MFDNPKKDADLDGMIDAPAEGFTKSLEERAADYANSLATQLRKGYLSYCVLTICLRQASYTSEIISSLREAKLVVVEGTIYPLLSRLQKDGLLKHEWRESEQGPPRKYYVTTEYGQEVVDDLQQEIESLNYTLKTLAKGAK